MEVAFYKQHHDLEKSHWWFVGRRRILGAVMEGLRVSGSRILDVGCGTGEYLTELARRYPRFEIHGIDFELEPLRFCRAEQSVPLSQADVTALPFESSTFDLVVALDTLEHVRDDERALSEIFRVSRPGGSVLLTVPAFPFLWGNVDNIGHHFRRYRRHELIRKVRAAGFSIRFVRFYNFILFVPIAALRLFARLLPGRPAGREDHIPSDFDLVKKGLLNSLLTSVFSMEASLVTLKVPFGVSLMCIATRPAGAD